MAITFRGCPSPLGHVHNSNETPSTIWGAETPSLLSLVFHEWDSGAPASRVPVVPETRLEDVSSETGAEGPCRGQGLPSGLGAEVQLTTALPSLSLPGCRIGQPPPLPIRRHGELCGPPPFLAPGLGCQCKDLFHAASPSLLLFTFPLSRFLSSLLPSTEKRVRQERGHVC